MATLDAFCEYLLPWWDGAAAGRAAVGAYGEGSG